MKYPVYQFHPVSQDKFRADFLNIRDKIKFIEKSNKKSPNSGYGKVIHIV